jgi:hypothetical protein
MKMEGVHTVNIVNEGCITNSACAPCMNCALPVAPLCELYLVSIFSPYHMHPLFLSPSLDEDWLLSCRITACVAHNEEGSFPNYHLVSISKIMWLTASFSRWTLDLHCVCPWWVVVLNELWASDFGLMVMNMAQIPLNIFSLFTLFAHGLFLLLYFVFCCYFWLYIDLVF